MKDDYFGDYLIDQPKEVEKAALAQQLATPAQKVYQGPAVPPPPIVGSAQVGSPMPPGFPMPASPGMPSVQAPTLPSANMNEPMSVTAPSIDIQGLSKQAKELKKEVGAPKAKSILDNEYALPVLGGLGLLAGTAALGYGLSKTEKKSIPDRDIRKIEPDLTVNKQSIPGVTEPTLHEPTFSFSQPETVGSTISTPTDITKSPDYIAHTNLENISGGPLTNADDANLVAKSERNKANNIVAQQAGVTPDTTIAEANTEVATRENALTDAEKAKQKIEIKDAIKPDLRTGSGMPAIQGTAPPGTKLKKELASIGDVPSTHAFVPGGQLMDIIRNSVGQEAYTASLAKYGFPSDQTGAHVISRLINQSMGRLNRDVAKDLNIGLGEPTKSITQKVAGGKAVKLAGATGALILMSDLANAKTDKEKREAMRNLGEALLPTSVTPTEAGAPTLPANAYSESKKLGSPFRQQLLGIAPPSR